MLTLATIPGRAQSGSAAAAARQSSASVDTLKALDRQVEDAFLRGNSTFLTSILGDDFRFWNARQTAWGKTEILTLFAKAGNFVSRKLTSVDAEVHGTVALTTGRIEVTSTNPRSYTVCYVRLYERRDGQWTLISHRTFREHDGFSETCAPQ